MGEPLEVKDFDMPIKGTVRMQTVHHEGLRRPVPILTVASFEQFGASRPPRIPDLLEPQLLTFGSDRGMMVRGYEEIDGRRFYQGWWITWA
jgi:hypothetical protein